jgi:hypothetical protein
MLDVSSRLSLPSAASSRTTVATRDFVMLAARNRSLARSATRGCRCETPAAARRTRVRVRTSASAPGAPSRTRSLTMRWRIGVARVDALGLRTCADAGDPQQSAIRAPAMRKAHEPRRSRIVQSVLLARTADKVAFHLQGRAGRETRRATPDHRGPARGRRRDVGTLASPRVAEYGPGPCVCMRSPSFTTRKR